MLNHCNYLIDAINDDNEKALNVITITLEINKFYTCASALTSAMKALVASLREIFRSSGEYI